MRTMVERMDLLRAVEVASSAAKQILLVAEDETEGKWKEGGLNSGQSEVRDLIPGGCSHTDFRAGTEFKP